jgi:hypothetical protein
MTPHIRVVCDANAPNNNHYIEVNPIDIHRNGNDVADPGARAAILNQDSPLSLLEARAVRPCVAYRYTQSL